MQDSAESLIEQIRPDLHPRLREVVHRIGTCTAALDQLIAIGINNVGVSVREDATLGIERAIRDFARVLRDYGLAVRVRDLGRMPVPYSAAVVRVENAANLLMGSIHGDPAGEEIAQIRLLLQNSFTDLATAVSTYRPLPENL